MKFRPLSLTGPALALASTALFCIPFSLQAAEAPAQPGSELPSYNVSGQRGVDGVPGFSFSQGAYSGANGENGGPAGPSMMGQDAGEIDLQLSSPLPGTVVITGRVIDPNRGVSDVQPQIVIGKSGYIYTRAVGGDGGNGASGGDGQGGGHGRSGQDASRFYPGENGENGGNGGNGGNGSPGSDGGHGGRVTLRVNQNDTSLLMLVKADVRGGAGGAAGRNGDGGSGGYGGSGGSSWYGVISHHNYYDPVTRRWVMQPVYGSMPGGVSGNSGYSGSPGMGDVSPGNAGENGEFQIQVTEKDGSVSTYSERYDLSLVSFEKAESNGDRIYEPGEEVTLSKIRVRNTGGMPTPGGNEINLYLQSQGWIVSEGQLVKIGKSLQPHGEYEVPGTLRFKIKDTQIQNPGSRFVSAGVGNLQQNCIPHSFFT